MFIQLVGAINAITAGFLMDTFGPKNVIAFGSLFGIIAIVIFMRIKENN